jgi:hypothetical protein
MLTFSPDPFPELCCELCFLFIALEEVDVDIEATTLAVCDW